MNIIERCEVILLSQEVTLLLSLRYQENYKCIFINNLQTASWYAFYAKIGSKFSHLGII